MANKAYFKPIKRECSQCGMLLTKEAFLYHDSLQCYAIEKKNKELEKEIREYGKFINQGLGI